VGVFTLGAGALVALSKSKKHFVGLTWADGDKKGGLAIQCDKNEYRGILAALEGVTGKKAVNSESMTVRTKLEALLLPRASGATAPSGRLIQGRTLPRTSVRG